MTNRVVTKRFTLDQSKAEAFNTDTLLLADFVKIPKGTKNILDIGTGSAVLMLDLAMKTKAKIDGVEIQVQRSYLANSNIRLNGLTTQLTVYNSDIKQFESNVLYDLIVSNPPFFKVNHTDQLSDNKEEMIARHEVELNLRDLLESVSRLLKFGGHFYMVHRPDRLDEIINYSRDFNLTVKEVRFVHPYIDKDANHLLIKIIKNGNQGIIIKNPLILYSDKTVLSSEMAEIIGGF